MVPGFARAGFSRCVRNQPEFSSRPSRLIIVRGPNLTNQIQAKTTLAEAQWEKAARGGAVGKRFLAGVTSPPRTNEWAGIAYRFDQSCPPDQTDQSAGFRPVLPAPPVTTPVNSIGRQEPSQTMPQYD